MSGSINKISDESYKALKDSVALYYPENKLVAIQFAEKYLLKAVKEKNITRKIEAYELLCYVNSDNNKTLYADSLISMTKDLKSKEKLFNGRIYRAAALYNAGRLRESLDEFLRAKHILEENKLDSTYRQLLNVNLGILYNEIDEYKALEIFREDFKTVKAKSLNSEDIYAIYRLANAYNKIGELDSAEYYLELGKSKMHETLKKDSLAIYFYELAFGINRYLKQDYNSALKYLSRSLKIGKTSESRNFSISINNSYIGKTYVALNQPDKAVFYFSKVDSLYTYEGALFKEIPSAYQFLINYYREKGDTQKQLKYINRLLEVDSILDEQYKNLSTKIYREYETPKLLAEKQELIHNLEKDKHQHRVWLWLSGVLVLGLCGFAVHSFRKQRTYKKHFRAMMDDLEYHQLEVAEPQQPMEDTEETSPQMKGENTKVDTEKDDPPPALDINPTVVDSVLQHLKEFERRKQFTRSLWTQNLLAEEFETNSAYLSKIIKHHKKKSFKQYLNDLRLDHAVQLLRNDPKFRRYSIESIAQETGFGTAQTFSTAFRKKFGLKPSYFIRNLEKELNSQIPNKGIVD